MTGNKRIRVRRRQARRLFRSFFRIGMFTFGGGYAMIPMIRREIVDYRKWVSPGNFLDLLTVAQTAPGPISLNTAAFVGYNIGGYRGAFTATLGAVLPSFAIMLLLAVFFADIRDNHVVEAVFKGMRPAVVALIVAPVIGLAKGMKLYRIGVAALVAAAIWRFGTSPVWFIIVGAAAGILWAARRHRKNRASEMEDDNGEKSGTP